MFKDNLVQLRKLLQMTQEDVAENFLALAGMIAKLK